MTDWSPEHMIARLGGDEGLARQLVTLFIDECPKMLARIRDGVAQGSADQIRRAAHAFKGSVSNFTAGAPTTTAFELECLGRDNRVTDVPATLATLEREVASLLEQLRVFDAAR